MNVTEEDLRKYVGCRDEDEVGSWPTEKFVACERLVSQAMLRLRYSRPDIATALEGSDDEHDYDDVEEMLEDAVAGEWVTYASEQDKALVIDDVLAHGGVER